MPHTSSKGVDGAHARNILCGGERIVSHSGTSQFSIQGTGTSACGLAVLNFIRLVFEREKTGVQDENMLQHITSKRFLMEVTSICAGWSSDLHLEVEDIYGIPLFDKTLKPVATKYGRPGIDFFTNVLHELQGVSTSAAVVITRPPEIIGCLKFVTSVQDLFIIFDSHTRPNHPKGAGLIFNTSVSATASRLAEILPFDPRLLERGQLQWQAQLLANCSGHIFVPGLGIRLGAEEAADDLMQIVLESSLEILTLRSEVSDLRFQNSTSKAENRRLTAELEQMEEELREERRKRHRSKSRARSTYPVQLTNAEAGPSRTSFGPRSPGSRNTFDAMIVDQAPMHSTYTTNSCPFVDATALELQHQYDEEDRRLRAQKDTLVAQEVSMFRCSVCLEDYSEENVIRLDLCDHALCRTCTKEYVSSKLQEHRFPILCPLCMTEDRKDSPGTITEPIVQQSGISNEEFDIWVELQMGQFSTLVHCRKCKRSAYVDKQDLDDARILVCPLPGCGYLWCKACQQPVPLDGPTHSCDGTSELDHLMKQRGWKYCPSCKTPIQKETGCNHMTCMTPGCNTHFCYVCGAHIITSALRRDIQSGVAAHYRICNLFETADQRG